MSEEYIKTAVKDLHEAVTAFCEKANGVKVEYLVEYRDVLRCLFWELDQNTQRIDDHNESIRVQAEYDEIMRAQAALRGQTQ